MAKAAQTTKVKVNLMVPMGVQGRPGKEVLNWGLEYGKYIVVIVILALIGMLLTRFKLSADLRSLKNDIRSEVNKTEQMAKDEIDIRQLQERLAQIKQVYTTQPDWKTTLEGLSGLIPENTRLSSLSLNHQSESKSVEMKMSGQALNNNEMAVLLGGLKNGERNSGLDCGLEENKSKPECNLSDDKKKLFKNILVTNLTLDESIRLFNIQGESNE